MRLSLSPSLPLSLPLSLSLPLPLSLSRSLSLPLSLILAGSHRQHALYIWDKATGSLVKMLTGQKGETLLDVVVRFTWGDS